MGDPVLLQQRIKNTLLQRGLSLTVVADQSGLSIRQVRRLVNQPGKRGPGLDTIEQLATALGVSASWLAFGEG